VREPIEAAANQFESSARRQNQSFACVYSGKVALCEGSAPDVSSDYLDGAQSRRLSARMRAEGYSTLEDLEAHHTGGDNPMSPLNYIWYQCQWQYLAANVFDADSEDGLVRFWDYFHATSRFNSSEVAAAALAALLRTEVSETLGRAIQDWR
jgi:hypothetical protein